MPSRRSRPSTCDVFNIRLSKCGGFLNSLRLAALAQQHGLTLSAWLPSGESGILSAAGRHWAASVAGIRWLEGSYDRHVLAEAAHRARHHLRLRRLGARFAASGPGRNDRARQTRIDDPAERDDRHDFRPMPQILSKSRQPSVKSLTKLTTWKPGRVQESDSMSHGCNRNGTIRSR